MTFAEGDRDKGRVITGSSNLTQAGLQDNLEFNVELKNRADEEAALNARKVLDEYGGAFLSDVVGLGKTWMAALLAQQLDGRHLVIAPPHLLDE